MRLKCKEMKGITLIALVITIIVLLILAAVTIATLTGENGILTQANRAKENTRAGEIQEYIDLTIVENEIANNTNGMTKSRYRVIKELYETGRLTSNEVEQLNSSSIITIGSISVNFSELEDKVTLGDVYTDDMIGQAITYSSNEVSDWIVFGKDMEQNILITTAEPIKSEITVEGTPKAWLTYKDDLNNACSIYGGTIQETTINARSITLKDINYVTGYTEPELQTFTFGPEEDSDNNKVQNYYPSLGASSNGYWQNSSEIPASFEVGRYSYNSDYVSLNSNRLEYIFGNSENPMTYLVADRSLTYGEGALSSACSFSVAYVSRDIISNHWYGYYFGLCYSTVSGGYDYDSITDMLGSGIRPVVVIPDNTLVEKNVHGLWDIKY